MHIVHVTVVTQVVTWRRVVEQSKCSLIVDSVGTRLVAIVPGSRCAGLALSPHARDGVAAMHYAAGGAENQTDVGGANVPVCHAVDGEVDAGVKVGYARCHDVQRHRVGVPVVGNDERGVRHPADGEDNEDDENDLALSQHLVEGRRLVAHGGA